jgi:hypothetical protein
MSNVDLSEFRVGRVSHQLCVVGRWLASLDSENEAKFVAAFEKRDIAVSEIFRVSRQYQYAGGESSMMKHRVKGCCCGRS